MLTPNLRERKIRSKYHQVKIVCRFKIFLIVMVLYSILKTNLTLVTERLVKQVSYSHVMPYFCERTI